MESTPIIEIDHVSMRFNMNKERVDSIKEYVIRMMKHQLFFEEFWALRDVSLRIEPGEVFGLVGLNGAGKSTLLKIVAGVLKPTEGSVAVRGSIAPLIELGAGFDKAYMKTRYREIIDFAELWDFVDVPVKNFSSGMYARLGFAIATMVKPDVLIVDEILGVGDYRFQEKCQERIHELMSGGTTVLMVSHNNGKIKEFCGRAAWLENGKLKMVGPADEVCGRYQEG